jgi:hypothetical protein
MIHAYQYSYDAFVNGGRYVTKSIESKSTDLNYVVM